METIENTIIQNLVTNEEYTRKVLPFLKPDYFDKTHEKIIFDECAKFIVSYDKCPTKEILSIECEKRKDINDDTYYCSEIIYEGLQFANNEQQIMQLNPMTFNKPGTDTPFIHWIEYYKELNHEIPEGELGIKSWWNV